MGVCNRLKLTADPVVTTATSTIVHTRRRSVCRISCGEYMLPLPGVVSSVNISDRFHLGVESKTFLRYFQFFSRERSRILVHRAFGNEIRALFLTQTLARGTVECCGSASVTFGERRI